MPGCQRNDYDPTAPAPDLAGADNGVLRIIATFHDHVWPQSFHEVEWGVLGKNYNEIDALERAEHVATLGVAADRARGAFQPSHRFVAIDTDDKCIGGVARSGENVDVAGM